MKATRRNILICGAVAIISLLGSCSKSVESDGGALAPGTIQVQLVVPTDESNKSNSRAAVDGTEAENFVGKVQMVLWNITENRLERYISIDPSNPVVDDATVWDKSTGTLKLRDANYVDNLVIYVMANGNGDELAGTFATQDEILNAMAEHSRAILDPATDPLPMSGISQEVRLTADNSTKVTVELCRMVAKVNVEVKIDADFMTDHPGCEFGTAAGQATTLQLSNAPGKSYIFEKTPITIPSDAIEANTLSEMVVTESSVDKTWTATAYVFENPTADPATSMKVALNMPYKIDANKPLITSNKYEVEINHAATSGTMFIKLKSSEGAKRFVRIFVNNSDIITNALVDGKWMCCL